MVWLCQGLCEDATSVALSSGESEDFVFVETSHPNKVLEGLNRLRLDNVFCDVILCCGGQEFPGHRNVLASFSSYFEAMFTTDLMESKQERVSISGVEPEMIGLLFKYAYTSKVVISMSNVQALLAASHLLNVTAVQEACCHYMERHMDEKNCVAIQGLAEAYSCKMLEKRSRDYILEHFMVVCQQEEFLSLSVDRLTEILASDDLNVSKEETVFEAAMMWLNKCPSTHRQSFEKVLEKIRLPLITPSYLHDVIESLDVVKESQGCQRLISEAKKQDILPYSHRAQPRWCTVPEVIVMTVWGETEEEEQVEVPPILQSFDPLTNQWRTLGRLPFPVCKHGLVVSGSSLYLAGGRFADGSVSRELWRYDPSCDLWLEMAPMNKARYEFGLVVLDGYVYAVGGVGVFNDSVERYDPYTNTWQLMEGTKPACDVITPAVVTLDGLIYVIDGEVMIRVLKYNPKSSVWTIVNPMQIPRADSAICTLKGKIYVIGGLHLFTCTDSVECYNPETNQWTMCARMKRPRSSPGVAVVDGKIYVLGGEDRFINTIERYCEETDTWDVVGEMPTSHCSLRCVSLRMRVDAHAANESATAATVPVN